MAFTAKMQNKKNKPKGKIKKLFVEHKKLAIALSIIAFLILSFAAYRIWLNIHFLITDDLILSLEPQDISLSIHYDEKPNVTFSAGIENSLFCDAYCSYEFKDISAESIVDEGSFASRGIEKKFGKTYTLSADRIGSGQKLYSFNVQCNNIRTWHCLTNENKRKRTAFVTLNYGISDYEQFLKDTLKDNITKLANDLSLLDINIQQLNNRFFELGFDLNLNELENKKEILNNGYNQIVLEFENLERIWSEENYLLLSHLLNRSYDERIGNAKEKLGNISLKIGSVLARHNLIVESLNNTDGKLRSYNDTISFLGRIGSPFIKKHKELLNRTSELKLIMRQNSFANYTIIENEAAYLKLMADNFEKESNENFVNVYISGAYYSSLEGDIFCRIRGVCTNETDFSNVLKNSLAVDYKKAENACSLLDSAKNSYTIENNRSEQLMKNYNAAEAEPIIKDSKEKIIILLKKDIFGKIKNLTADEANASLRVLINISAMEENMTEEINYGNLSEEEALSLMQLNLTNSSKSYYESYCRIKQGFNLAGHYGTDTQLDAVKDAENGNFTSRISIELTPNYPVCCVFGECKGCCTQEECKSDPSLYPVLILHGHSFNKDNSPDFSLDAFNKILSSLQLDGYISAGTITPVSDYSEIKKGEWGLPSKPIIAKGSYYLVSYYNIGGYSIATQKSESIETYAIRLREIIDLLKFRTGKDKVNIIAHSMGSLVARSYIRIFGTDSVDNLILIAAPNKGISGKISSYCPLLGEKKECNDMSAESIFIKKLNDPLKTPKNTTIYNIIGEGCDMDGNTGDGVVTKQNAEIEYAENFYINGSCSGVELLHTQILNIEKHPEVYDTIKSILKTSGSKQ